MWSTFDCTHILQAGIIRFLVVSKLGFFDTEKSVYTPLVATVFPTSHGMAVQNHPQNFPDWMVALRREKKTLQCQYLYGQYKNTENTNMKVSQLVIGKICSLYRGFSLLRFLQWRGMSSILPRTSLQRFFISAFYCTDTMQLSFRDNEETIITSTANFLGFRLLIFPRNYLKRERGKSVGNRVSRAVFYNLAESLRSHHNCRYLSFRTQFSDEGEEGP